MPPQIGILGWGSLLWEGGTEFDRWHDDWHSDGLVLKIEFSRVSEKRMRALTLVIDQDHGVDTHVAWCLSRRRDIEDAVADLRSREGTTVAKVGCLLIKPDCNPEGLPETAIAPGARTHQLDAVVWTNLQSNFEEEVRQPFSVDEAVAHIQRLQPVAKVKAAEYIWRSPDFIRTPVREALEKEPWFANDDYINYVIIKGYTQLYLIINMTKSYVIYPIPPRIMKYNRI
jgi:hypothetical protein